MKTHLQSKTSVQSWLRMTKACGVSGFFILIVGNLWFISTLEDPRKFYRDKKHFLTTYVGAVRGDAESQFDLGNAYRSGRGTIKDHKKKIRWYREAAEQGHVTAQYNLGFAYRDEQGIAQDHSEALKWFRKAGVQGELLAQFMVGDMYRLWLGVDRDPVSALMWLRLVERTSPINPDIIRNFTKSMTAEQMDEAERRVVEMIEKHPAIAPPDSRTKDQR